MAKQKLPALDLSDVQLSVAGPEVAREHIARKGPRERSKAQKTLDTLVQRAYDKWVKAGKPDNFADRPVGVARVPEAQLMTVKRALQVGSGTFLNVSIRFGDIRVVEGYADVVFTATDRVKRPRKDKSE